LDYKIGPVSNHVAKFHGDRPRDLGDYALEKKKHHEHFISPKFFQKFEKKFVQNFSRFLTTFDFVLPLLRTGGLKSWKEVEKNHPVVNSARR